MRSGALPVPDLPSPPHPRYPNLTGAQTANLATRYPTHRKQRGGTFFDFLLTQYTRTKEIREKSIQRVQAENGQDLRRIWPILSLVFGRDIGATLFAERDRRTLALIENQTGSSFITGDQPVINLHGQQSPEPTETVSLYYPVTPRLALMLTEVGEEPPFSTGSLSHEDVATLDERIASAAHSQIFAAVKADLLPSRTVKSHDGREHRA